MNLFMKVTCLAAILLLSINNANAAIQILEFNISNSKVQGPFADLPRRYLSVRNEISWYYNGTTYINISRIVELPEGEYAYFSNKPENLNVDIDQARGIVGITPKQGWYGEEKVIIFADGIGKGSVNILQNIERDKLVYSAIGIDQLGEVFFDDALFSMFSSRFTGVFDAGDDSKIEVNGRIDDENNALMIDAGKDVRITASFYQQDGREKPKIEILIDAALADYNEKLGHCDDNIRNLGETGIDCGGECLACSIGNNDYTLIYATITLIGIAVIGYLIVKSGKLKIKRKKHREAKIKVNLEDVRQGIASEISALKSKVKDENIDDMLEALSRLVRNYFKTLFNIKYNFTYFELRDELKDRKISMAIRGRMLNVFSRISRAEYGHEKLSKKELINLIGEAVEIINRFEFR